MITAIKKNEELIAEMDSLLNDEKHFHLWWLGQSGFLLQWKGKRVLIDPYLSDSLTKKYLTTDKPHTRMSELVMRPELLKHISIVTSSHNHTDHLDAETLIPVLKNKLSIFQSVFSDFEMVIQNQFLALIRNNFQCIFTAKIKKALAWLILF